METDSPAASTSRTAPLHAAWACVVLALAAGLVYALASNRGASDQASDDGSSAPGPAKSLKFVALGHTRDIRPALLMRLAEAINEENPDYIFLLGDYTWDGHPDQWAIVDKFLARLRAPVVACPGNHEATQIPLRGELPVARPLRNYLKRFGTPYNSLITENANFLVINTSDKKDVVSKFLELKLPETDNGNPTFLMMHHRIWADDYPPHSIPQLWGPMVRLEEIEPLIAGKVQYLVAGDCVYGFGDFEVRGFRALTVGLGDAGKNSPMGFVVVNVDARGKVKVAPRHIPVPAGDPWLTPAEPFYKSGKPD